MKVSVTLKHVEEDKPIRGFIEAKDIKLLIFTNAHKQITKLELTLGKKLHVYKEEHPFIMWAQAEQEIEFYLQTQRPEAKDNKSTLLVNPTRVRAAVKKRKTK